MAELFEVMAAHGATAHFYADDGQLYISSLAADSDIAISQLTSCVADVDVWMKANSAIVTSRVLSPGRHPASWYEIS